MDASTALTAIVYGAPPAALATVTRGAMQVSPLVPGSARLEAIAPASLDAAVVYAPPGTVERRHTLALALRALKAGGELVVMALKDKGGSRLKKELEAFGCAIEEVGKAHHRICHVTRPADLTGVDAAIAAGAARKIDDVWWTQPGVFAWDRIDAGTQVLIGALPALKGKGLDMGCGNGLLARAVLGSADVKSLALVDIDRRAVDAARANIEDARASFHWADVRTAPELTNLDFVVTNPPFHDGGREDRALGQAFIRRAHEVLSKGGKLWLVANRHLPYEHELNAAFTAVALKAEGGGYKVFEARK